MKNFPKSITMVGAVNSEDSDDPESSDFESNNNMETTTTTQSGSVRNLLKNRKSEDAENSAEEDGAVTSADSAQKPAVVAETEGAKALEPPESTTSKQDTTRSDPPAISTTDVEKESSTEYNGDLKTDESLPLVHLGSPKGRKSNELASSSFHKTNNTANKESIRDPYLSEDSPSGGTMSTRTKVIMYFCYCLAIVFVLQGIIIGMVVDDNSKDAADNGNDSNLASTPSPTSVTPTDPPTTFVTESPSQVETFQSIASAPGAFRLEEVSTCDDCLESIYPGPTDVLPWNTFAKITEVVVDSNGSFELKCDLFSDCGLIELTGTMDLAPNVNGNIFAMWGKEEPRLRRKRRRNLKDYSVNRRQQQETSDPNLVTTLTLSWEDVNLFGFEETRRYRVNAQVKLSEEEIVFCYGRGDVNRISFRSGILNYTNAYEYTPVTIDGFDKDGFTPRFPSNECEVKVLG